MEQLDKIDWKIISILSKNARISLSHLSEQVYLTARSFIQNRKAGEGGNHHRIQSLHQL